MNDQTVFCMLLILFAGSYLSAKYLGKVFEKWLPSMPLRRAWGFTIIHTLFVLILALDIRLTDSIDSITWHDLLLIAIDFPVLALGGRSGLGHLIPHSALRFYLFAGGLQWFVVGLLAALISQAINRVSKRRRAAGT
jgi:hypothetical protein